MIEDIIKEGSCECIKISHEHFIHWIGLFEEEFLMTEFEVWALEAAVKHICSVGCFFIGNYLTPEPFPYIDRIRFMLLPNHNLAAEECDEEGNVTDLFIIRLNK